MSNIEPSVTVHRVVAAINTLCDAMIANNFRSAYSKNSTFDLILEKVKTLNGRVPAYKNALRWVGEDSMENGVTSADQRLGALESVVHHMVAQIEQVGPLYHLHVYAVVKDGETDKWSGKKFGKILLDDMEQRNLSRELKNIAEEIFDQLDSSKIIAMAQAQLKIYMDMENMLVTPTNKKHKI